MNTQYITGLLNLNSNYQALLFRYKVVSKRVIDLIISTVALIVLSPLFLIVAVLIRLDSKGPILFKQKRVGLGGTHFYMWKFRSMVNNAEVKRAGLENANEMRNGVLFKMKADPRITRVGAYIRKASIDELPQLINVLKGDMSLVGPRPPLPAEVEHYKAFDYLRLSVLPGITCLWQVQGRSEIPFSEQVKLDIEYIEKQSVCFDLLLLLKTIPAVISAKGAY